MFRRVKKWAARTEKFLHKPKMVRVTCTIQEPNGDQKTIVQERQETLLSIIRDNGLDISSYCGGMCSCGTCIVDIEGSQNCLSPIASREIAVLGYSNRDTARLACQATIIGEGEVYIKLRKPL